MDAPKVGELITDGDRRRDAIHVAIAPVTATAAMYPGTRVGFAPGGGTEKVRPTEGDDAVGVVDPFLPHAVVAGQRFWLFLFPGTVTGLRHVWTHPAFTAAYQARLADLAIKSRDKEDQS